MIQMYPKAVVLTNRHPFGGTDMMAQSIASALVANGYDSHVVSINDDSFQGLGAHLADPRLGLVMTTGTLPLQIASGGVPIWRAVRPDVRFVTYVIDAWPYDAVRVQACRQFLDEWPSLPNVHLASLEANDARLIGRRAHHMPSGAYPAPRRRGPKQQGGRLMVWASANKELAVTPVHSAFEETLRANNHWGLDAARIARVAAELRETPIVHGLSAIGAALGRPLDEIARPADLPSLTALAAIDSCLKRYRRVKVVQALKGLPVDIYGENWQQHVGNVASFRLLTPSPNHNHAFSHICQHYAGLVNFDPNFGHGTNERAVSALALGIPIANNHNPRTDDEVGCIPYRFDDRSIRDAAERLLAYDGDVPLNAEFAWEYLVCKLLGEIAAEAPLTGERDAGEREATESEASHTIEADADAVLV